MKKHGRNLNASCWVKEINLKRLHFVQCQLHDILEKSSRQKVSGCQGLREGRKHEYFIFYSVVFYFILVIKKKKKNEGNSPLLWGMSATFLHAYWAIFGALETSWMLCRSPGLKFTCHPSSSFCEYRTLREAHRTRGQKAGANAGKGCWGQDLGAAWEQRLMRS